MRKVIIPNGSEVRLSSLTTHAPLFAKRDGEIRGMVAARMDVNTISGWRLLVGGAMYYESAKFTFRSDLLDYLLSEGFEIVTTDG